MKKTKRSSRRLRIKTRIRAGFVLPDGTKFVLPDGTKRSFFKAKKGATRR